MAAALTSLSSCAYQHQAAGSMCMCEWRNEWMDGKQVRECELWEDPKI